MIHIKVFETNAEYNIYTFNNTMLDSGILYYIKEDDTAHMFTNNIDGTNRIYNFSKNEADIPKEDLTDEEFAFSVDSASANQTGSFVGPSFTNTYDLPVTYQSSNPNVATVDEYGTVTVLANGTTTISVVFAGDAHYNSKTISYTLKVTLRRDLTDKELGWKNPYRSVIATELGHFEGMKLNNVYNLPVTYLSDDPVATIDANGNITIVGNGSTWIVMHFEGNELYNPKDQWYVLNVAIPQELTDNEFSWSASTATATQVGSFNGPTLTNTHNLPVWFGSSDSNVVTVSTGMGSSNYPVINVISNGTATITAAFLGNDQYKPKTVTYTLTVAIQQEIPNEALVWSHNAATATVAGQYSGPNLTNAYHVPITYSSSDTSVATINSEGTITIIANGTTTISANFAGNSEYAPKSASYILTVAIPQELSNNEFKWTNDTVTVTQSGAYSGNPLVNTHNLPVTYSSSDTNYVQINSSGQVNVILNSGQAVATITALFEGNAQYKDKTVTYTMNIDVQADLIAEELSFSSASATVTSASNVQVPTITNAYNLPLTYSSSNTSVATVDSSGNVTIIGNGTATISASFAGDRAYNPKTISYTLTVAIPQTLSDAEFSWPINSINITNDITETVSLTNTHHLPVTYTSSNENVVIYGTGADIGALYAVNDGTATITASFAGNAQYKPKTVSFTVVVDVQYDINNEDFKWSALSAKATAAGSFDGPTLTNTNNLSPITYSSSDTNVATINSNGQVTIVANGNATISAIFAGDNYYNAKTVTYTLVVEIPQQLTDNEFSWSASTATATQAGSFNGPTFTNTHNLSVWFESSDTSVVEVSTGLGGSHYPVINVISNGTAIVSARFNGNSEYAAKTVTYTLTVAIPNQLSNQEFGLSTNSAQITSASDIQVPVLTNTHNLPVTYSSSDTTVATVNANGEITPVGNGTTTISVIFAGNEQYAAKTVTYTLTVAIPQELSYNDFSWTDSTGQYSATSGANVPTLTNNLNLAVTYSSSNTSIATIDSNGTITPVDNGNTTISAIFAGNAQYKPKTVTYTLTVKDIKANLTNQEFSWDDNSGEAGASQTRVPSLINTHDLPVSYSSSNTNVATVDSNGNVTAVANGTATISAIFAGDNTYNPKTVTYTLTVSGIKQNLTDAQFGWDPAADSLWTWVAGDPYPHLAESRSKGTTTGITFVNSLSLPVTFTSSNTNVATIGNSLTFAEYWTLAGTNGSTLISATFAGNDTYNPKTAAYWLDVTLSKLSANISWSSNSAQITSASDTQVPTLNNPNNLTVTYSSSDTSVATVDASGGITPVENGTTTISAIFAGNDAYNSSTVTYTLTVSLVRDLTNEEFAWSNGGAAVTSYQENGGELSNAPTLINTNNLVVRYWSSDTDVARINNDTGVITLTGSGTTTISAIFVGNSNFNAKTISYDLTADISAHIITTSSNASLMTIVRNNNWAANSDFMTQSEAEKVTNIGTVFKNNTNLTSFTEFQYFTNVTDVPYEAFSGCTNMASITLPSSITGLAGGAFVNCSSLTSIVIPNSVTNNISSNIFSGCSSLANVTLSNNQTIITSSMFENCTSLRSITIPNSIYSINAYAFTGCTNLATINVGSGNSAYTSVDGVLYNKAVTILQVYPQGKQDTSYTIPNTVTNISYKIENNTYLTEVYIPSSVTTMESSFSGCTNLVSVTVDIETPLTINRWTFSNRSNAYLYVPTGCSAAYQAADYWKEFLSIEETGTDYPSDALITMTDDPGLMTAINNNNLIQHESQDYFTESEAAAVTNEQFVGTFWGNNDITMFAQLGYFTSLTTLPTLGSGDSRHGSFEQCLNLEDVSLPPNITTFGSRTFAMTNSLRNIDMGYIIVKEGQSLLVNITSLGDSMFYQSNYPEVANFLNELSDSSITTIPEHCFAFVGPQNLGEITIPASVTGIGSFAFATQGSDSSMDNYNPWITTVEMGANIAQIDSYAFREQSALEKVIIHATTPPQIASNTFQDTGDSFIIYVPHASMNAYKTNSIKGWSTYADRIRSIEGDLPFD